MYLVGTSIIFSVFSLLILLVLLSGIAVGVFFFDQVFREKEKKVRKP